MKLNILCHFRYRLLDFSRGSGSILVFYLKSDYNVVSLTARVYFRLLNFFPFHGRRRFDDEQCRAKVESV